MCKTRTKAQSTSDLSPKHQTSEIKNFSQSIGSHDKTSEVATMLKLPYYFSARWWYFFTSSLRPPVQRRIYNQTLTPLLFQNF